ncbi:CHAD domain protein [mine drainage metagenome]|uniref:CHAD domain protein n=1 Tax=mine drainage metagenome TaxID=410659 RepID=A0A1J5PK05_9ZZZZ
MWAERVRAGDDAHDVHQLRVVLRRLRSTLRWLRGRAARRALSGFDAELRWTMQIAAPVRDADVALPLLRAVDAAPAAIEALRRERDVHLARLRSHLRGARFARLLLALARWAELDAVAGDLRELARDAVRTEQRAWRAAQRRAAPVLARGAAAGADEVRALHVLRIRCKRLRLACERFGGVLPKPRRHAALARRCEKLQGVLGNWHDVERLRAQAGGALDAAGDTALRARAADALRAAHALLGD